MTDQERVDLVSGDLEWNLYEEDSFDAVGRPPYGIYWGHDSMREF